MTTFRAILIAMVVSAVLRAGALAHECCHDSIEIAVTGITADAMSDLCDSITWRDSTTWNMWRTVPPDTCKPKSPGVYKYTLKIDTTFIRCGETREGDDLYRRQVDTAETWEPFVEKPRWNTLEMDTVITW